jgi:predicted transcriptional regulator
MSAPNYSVTTGTRTVREILAEMRDRGAKLTSTGNGTRLEVVTTEAVSDRYVAAMLRDGLIKPTNGGQYVITDEGRRAAIRG